MAASPGRSKYLLVKMKKIGDEVILASVKQSMHFFLDGGNYTATSFPKKFIFEEGISC